jgi:RNA polymerase sigma factor (sigma-70 family)
VTQNATTDPWVDRLREGSPDRENAVEELRAILVRGLSRSLTNRYGQKIQVEDVAQEALIKILDSLDSFEGRSRFTTWAMTIATRVGISELRRKRFQDVSLESITDADGLKIEIAVDSATPTEDQMERKSILKILDDLIQSKLTDKQRQAIQALLAGLPVEEIASRTDSNRNAVYKLVHDARLKLRQGLERFGIDAESITSAFA